MKKIIIIILLILNIDFVYAIENIEINNEYLIPEFNPNIKKYNYYTSKEQVNIKVTHENNERIEGDGIHNILDGKNEIIIASSNKKEYIISVFKDYKDNNDKCFLEKLDIEGFNINFSRNIHEYSIDIDGYEYLNIDYSLSSDRCSFSINGNGNFNKNDNIILIKVDDEEYIIHCKKSKLVSFTYEDNEEVPKQKKEIIILIISIISLIIIAVYFYSLFIFH